MTTYDNAMPQPDWAPDCRCDEVPCPRAKSPAKCIADQGDDERDQA